MDNYWIGSIYLVSAQSNGLGSLFGFLKKSISYNIHVVKNHLIRYILVLKWEYCEDFQTRKQGDCAMAFIHCFINLCSSIGRNL